MRFCVVLCILLAGCDLADQEARFQEGCENTLRERLKSPSSLHVLKFTDFSKPIQFEPGEADRLRAEMKRLEEIGTEEANHERSRLTYRVLSIESDDRIPTMYQAYISYEADNSYGASIANIALCEFESLGGEISDFDMNGQIEVDGYDTVDWIIHQTDKYVD